MTKKANPIIIVAMVLALAAMSFCAYHAHQLSEQQRKIKEDFGTLNGVTFGIFSVNQWKDKVAAIVNNQIQTFNFTGNQQKNLEKEVEQILNALINKALAIVNKPQKTFVGKIRKFAVHTFVNPKELHDQVPVFAKEIIKQVNNPSSKKRLRGLAQSKFNQLEKTTFDSSLTAEQQVREKIYAKYHVKSTDAYNQKTDSLLKEIKTQSYTYTYGLMGGSMLFLLVWWLFRKNEPLYKPLFVLSILAAAILLVVGVSSTMIDVEARVKLLDFKLLGQEMIFKNQILFFQSKGILEVVLLLLKASGTESMVVGALILCFSILFPVSKLSSGLIYLLGSDNKWTRGKVVHYFAFDSGKWSMADVMVIAIMMTYLGFNGILDSQLAVLNIKTSYLASITTNNTALQPGFFIFVTFVLFSLIMSEILKRVILPAEKKAKGQDLI
ncbi:paraquat-inducible protein A [uncultured Mucilaginibacter sp.]|uniref:paraquat-inducible protein A n=1 Tax=uncultured Mucilaginibacter sp. TaxID=797541 RepID=UPI00261016B5|nr:paraquat-inducible protein A [uncultured Mucilaginibacter sp.]